MFIISCSLNYHVVTLIYMKLPIVAMDQCRKETLAYYQKVARLRYHDIFYEHRRKLIDDDNCCIYYQLKMTHKDDTGITNIFLLCLMDG